MSIVRTQNPEQLVRDYAAYLNGDESKAQILAEDLRAYGPGMPAEGIRGIKAFQKMLGGFAAAFPDLEHTIDTIAAAGDVVLTEWTVTGTHKGEFGGAPATGKSVTMKTAAAYTVKNGQIVEERAYFNIPDLMAQIGAT